MNSSLEILDCTLRDGAYIVDGLFGKPAIKGIIKKLQEANIEIIECGWLKNTEYVEGSTYYHVPDDLKQYLLTKSPYSTYVVMIDWDRYNLENLPMNDGQSIDAIRVVFPYEHYAEGMEVGKEIREKGYKVFLQAANTLAYSDADLLELAKKVNELKPEGLSIVDTFGAMYHDDLDHIVHVLDHNLDREIKLGFHSHNNQQLSFSLSIRFADLLMGKRDIIVDSSLCGMGRGAGNTTTELISNYLNRKYRKCYDMNTIMDAIDVYMENFQEKYSWGYSIPYFIAGMYCTHVNNISYLMNNHRTSSRDMRSIIESVPIDSRKKYDYDLLEKKYLENQNRVVDDEKEMDALRNKLSGREILLLAPGKSLELQNDTIREYIDERNPIIIGVNALFPKYDYDFLFVINAARYLYAEETYADIFSRIDKIVLSNVKTKGRENEFIINFNRVVKFGWKYFDNAVINCLRLMDALQVTDVKIGGFDPLGPTYNESYVDKSLPTINPDNNWDELNMEIKDMYADFYESAKSRMKITFITDSLFNQV